MIEPKTLAEIENPRGIHWTCGSPVVAGFVAEDTSRKVKKNALA